MVPSIILSSTGYQDVVEADPRLSNELCLLVVIENADLELVIIR